MALGKCMTFQGDIDTLQKTSDKYEKRIQRLERKVFYYNIIIPLYIVIATTLLGIFFKLIYDHILVR
jgi:hypothetical protein